jgi:hypothetical protein
MAWIMCFLILTTLIGRENINRVKNETGFLLQDIKEISLKTRTGKIKYEHDERNTELKFSICNKKLRSFKM